MMDHQIAGEIFRVQPFLSHFFYLSLIAVDPLPSGSDLHSPEQKIMVYPPKIEDAFELPEEKLSSFLAFVNPKRVILLGGTEVIPPKYRLAVGPKTERAEIEDLNWNINSVILGNLLMDREMQKKFRSALNERSAGTGK